MLPDLVYSYIKPWMNTNRKNVLEVKEITENLVKSRERKTIEYVKQMIKPYWNI